MARTPSTFAALGIEPVINAAGKMTALGASVLSPATRAAMDEASARFVDLAALMKAADRTIAAATGAEAGFITSCSAAGIVIATAACVTRGDLARTEALPFLAGPPDEVVIQRGHVVHFGAPILQMIALTGARPVEIGATNRTQPNMLKDALSPRTAAVMFVVSHHTYPSGFVGLAETVRIAHERGVPVIVDAAAETDLRKYVAAGADLVIYSGHKSLNAPTSGIVAGRRALIDACLQQNGGIGRAMKIGKEGIIGALAALEQYVAAGEPGTDMAAVEGLAARLQGIPGLAAAPSVDPTRPEIVRVRLTVDPATARIDGRALVARLTAHAPSIRTRNHDVEHGVIEIDFRTLQPGDADVIADAVRLHLA
ncbi:MAG: aminotransferase class V-fold PLP-dependent enzyme [Rhizobiales bacterium]|nr:aminotransferase class V-fold PLP-dependent enzyme [Hyphomicrobiales bacterium]